MYKEKSLEEREAAQKKRHLAKFGKKVQIERTLEKHKEKREILEKIKKYRKVGICFLVWVLFIYNGLGFAPALGHLVLCVLSASETGLPLVVKLGRNVVIMLAGVKIMHQSNARRP